MSDQGALMARFMPMSQSEKMKMGRRSIVKCAEWLAFCLRIGWQQTDLDFLERLWWKYHDKQGYLK